MNVYSEYQGMINAKKDVQIWNNGVFDNTSDSECLKSNNLIQSNNWLLNKPPVSINPCSDSFDSSFSSKENQSHIGLTNSSVLVHRSKPKPKPLKNLEIKNGSLKSEDRGKKTDEEIEIENEISRLYAKLESIRSKKVEQNGNKILEKQGKNKDSGVQKMEESGFSKGQFKRRGFSLGPNEIMSASNSNSKQMGTTPVQSTNRRKSCFWELDDIQEENFGFSKVRNSSLRQAVTTVGSKKGIKKDDLILASVQPKKLFGEQSVPVKKPLKPGRVIASRYNQPTINSSMKNRSFTDNPDRKSRGGTEGRVKKKWENPNEIVVPKRLELYDDSENETDEFVGPIGAVMPIVLPRIRAVRIVDNSGQDSGPAKRVAELVGKKSYFQEEDDEEEEAVSQKLSFEED